MTDTQGRFIWYELMTTDQRAAETFYCAVVGWKTTEADPPNTGYTILWAGERSIGGMMTLPAEACKEDIGPGWTGYIAVSDADAAAKRIVESGGSIHHGPDDIPDVGRFAVVADPGGATFMLLTSASDEPMPAVAPDTLGTVGWHELYAGNGQEASFAFYAGQFGWTTVDQMDMGAMGKYRLVGLDGTAFGAMMDKPAQAPVSAWGFYFNVDAIDAAIERIAANGGQVLMGPIEVPGGSWIVQATDPQGAIFALLAPRR